MSKVPFTNDSLQLYTAFAPNISFQQLITRCSNNPEEERLPTIDDIEVLIKFPIVVGSLYPISSAKVLVFFKRTN